MSSASNIYVTPFSSVSIVDFEYVGGGILHEGEEQIDQEQDEVLKTSVTEMLELQTLVT